MSHSSCVQTLAGFALDSLTVWMRAFSEAIIGIESSICPRDSYRFEFPHNTQATLAVI